MTKAEIASVTGAALSTILSALSFVYDLGPLQILFPVLTGAFITYIIQSKLQSDQEKRAIERQNYNLMRERIYGPILQYISSEMNRARDVDFDQAFFRGKTETLEPLKDYLYASVPTDIQRELSSLLDRLWKHNEMITHARTALIELIIQELAKTSDVSWEPNNVCVTVELKNIMISYVTLHQCLFLERSPKAFVQEQNERWGPKMPLSVECTPRWLNIDSFENLYNNLRKRMDEDDFFAEEKNQREKLMEQMKSFSERIRPFVNLS